MEDPNMVNVRYVGTDRNDEPFTITADLAKNQGKDSALVELEMAVWRLAIDLANATPYGLQAGIFTTHVDRAIGWARRLRFGAVLINETPTFRADQMPYGGVKDSGNTREGPAAAVQSMTESRLVVINLPGG